MLNQDRRRKLLADLEAITDEQIREKQEDPLNEREFYWIKMELALFQDFIRISLGVEPLSEIITFKPHEVELKAIPSEEIGFILVQESTIEPVQDNDQINSMINNPKNTN